MGKSSLFVWLVADGWCWFVLREKYCWLVADKPSEQAYDGLKDIVSTWITINHEVLFSLFQGQRKLLPVLGYV
jgi:hypothetical protein